MAKAARFTFFGGKGGVGKTTCAAAAAARAASEGRRVLVVSTDPAHSLGDALDAKLAAEPRPVLGARGLFAAQLDADRALKRWLDAREDAFRTIAERGTYLDDEDVDRLFSLSLPGVDELVGLLELTRMADARDYDEVVVDTAPTGHTLRLLEMPETLRRFAEVLDDMHAKHRFLASSLGGRWRPDAADEVIAGIEDDAKSLRDALRDPQKTTFTWITLPEPIVVDESEAGLAGLRELGVAVGAVVVNRVWPAPDRACALCSPRAAAEAEVLGRIAGTFGAHRLLEVPAAVKEPRGVPALVSFATSVRPFDTPRASPPRNPHTQRATRTRNAHAQAQAQAQAHAQAHAHGQAHAQAHAAGAVAPPGARLILVGGKGGVGKTTVASAEAIALASARPDAKVLLLSTDPAHSLGHAFDTAIGDEEKRIAGAPKNLRVRELDAKKAFEIERDKYRAAIDDLFASIFRGQMDAAYDRAVLEDLLDLAPPGIDELLAVITIVEALEDGKYDLVVVDTAPTGHTLRLLALPETALEWVHAIMEIILKYRKVVGLGELASDLLKLARQLHALITLLADRKRAAFVAVTRAADLPRLETERMVRALQDLEVPLAAVVVNAVTVPSCGRCEEVARAEAPEIAALVKLAERARASFVTVPAVHPPPRGVAALARSRSTWRAGMLGRSR